MDLAPLRSLHDMPGGGSVQRWIRFGFEPWKGGMMALLEDAVEIRTRVGDPITVGNTILVPESQFLAMRWPRGGWVWNRPVAVRVERAGHTQRIPIVDVTRVVQVVLLGITVVLWTYSLGRLLARSGRERRANDGKGD